MWIFGGGQDGRMGGSRRIPVAVAIVVVIAGIVLVGVGVFFVVVGLDDADRWSSVFSMFLTAAGLGLTGYGVVLTRRGLAQQQLAAGQRVGGDVEGPNLQIGRAGDVRVGQVAGRPRRAPRRARPPGPVGGQEVGGSVRGRNVQIGQADDVDID
ncbi:hypothetical protein ACQP1W_50005 [Spirillospora sp. CA-255316]